jgi:hypothetical protein
LEGASAKERKLQAAMKPEPEDNFAPNMFIPFKVYKFY